MLKRREKDGKMSAKTMGTNIGKGKVFVETPRKFIYCRAFDPLARIFISANNFIQLALMKIRAYGSKALQ